MGGLVNRRHHLLVSRRRATAGLHIPVPGVSLMAVMPPENTAQSFNKTSRGMVRVGLVLFSANGINTGRMDRPDFIRRRLVGRIS